MSFLRSLGDDLVLAGMDYTPQAYLKLCTIPAAIFGLNGGVLVFFALKGSGLQWLAAAFFLLIFGLAMLLCTILPRLQAHTIGAAIEADLFVPGRMLVTLIESGNSLVSAFDRVSKTHTVSGRYFGKIAAEIELGKNLDQAITDAIHHTPSKSFQRVLEPIRTSILTGAPIQETLVATLEDLTQEKIVEIERYEKRLAPVSMFRIVQTEKLVVLVYEAFNLWRQVHLDGREWADDLNPSWMGYSKGRWEGDALVVETRGLNGKQWLDHGGLPASDKLTVIERFRRPSFGRLEIDITINDPTYYTKPWTATTNLRAMPDTELFEFICNENERSTKHMGPNIK